MARVSFTFVNSNQLQLLTPAMMSANTALGPEIDLRFYQNRADFPKGIRKDGFFEIPGQHHYDGMYIVHMEIPAELERIRHSLELNEKDVVSSAYPKTGNSRKIPVREHAYLCRFMSCIHVYICMIRCKMHFAVDTFSCILHTSVTNCMCACVCICMYTCESVICMFPSKSWQRPSPATFHQIRHIWPPPGTSCNIVQLFELNTHSCTSLNVKRDDMYKNRQHTQLGQYIQIGTNQTSKVNQFMVLCLINTLVSLG